ncbi:MAG: divergent polysaccharide deacetylase family protein [Halopseudomonas aestusnigri]
MNWNKIVLIISWVALVSMISAAAGYTIYGPHVPLPYIYTPDNHTKAEEDHPSDPNSEETHNTGNLPDDTAGEDNHGKDEADHSADAPSDTHETAENAGHAEDPEAPTSDHVTGKKTSESIPPEGQTHTADEVEVSHKDETDHAEPEEHASVETEPHETVSSSEHEGPVPATEQDDEGHAATEETSASSHATQPPVTDTHTPEQPAHETQEVASLAPTDPTHEDALNNAPSWKRYGQKPPPADGRPKIAIVLTGLGLSRAATEAAIRQLPQTITLSFTPYARDLESWIALARSHHHEVLLDLPMEPLTYPSDDPGPQALLTGRQPEGNINNLAWIANRGSGFVGMSAYMGDRFVTSERQMKPVMEYFKDHGLLFLDNGRNKESVALRLGSEYGVPIAVNQRAIDEAQLSRMAIDSRLAQVEQIALKNGFAIATGRPYPVTLERIASWIHDLESKGFQLVPLTAVVSDPEATIHQPDTPVTTTSAAAGHETEKDKGDDSGH